MADIFTNLVEGAGGKRRKVVDLSLDEKRRLIASSCHPKQRDFVADTGLYIAALTGRGCGKTTGLKARLLLRLLGTPKARCLYIATTRDQAIDLLWNPLKDTIDALGIPAKYNETALRVHLANGSMLRLVGADNMRDIEKYRGQPFHEVCIDESASYPAKLMEHLVDRIIGPRLGDYNGSLVLVGTPGHTLAGLFYEVTRTGSDIGRLWGDRHEFPGWDKWSVHRWNLQDGAPTIPALARLWDRALRDKLAKGWSDTHPVWRREYLGEWAADDTATVYSYRAHDDSGEAWNQWDPPRGVYGFAQLPEKRSDWRYVYGLDFGHSDPTAVCVLAFSPSDPAKTLYHVYSFEQRRMYPRTIAELLLGPELNHDKPGGLFGVTGWPDAIVADVASLGGGYLDELQNVYGIQIHPAPRGAGEKHSSIEMANGDLIDGRVKVLKGSPLEEQMLALQWSVDEFGVLKEQKGTANHSTDAFVYARRHAHHLLSEEAPPPRVDTVPRGYVTDVEPEFTNPAGEFHSILGDESEFSLWQ